RNTRLSRSRNHRRESSRRIHGTARELGHPHLRARLALSCLALLRSAPALACSVAADLRQFLGRECASPSLAPEGAKLLRGPILPWGVHAFEASMPRARSFSGRPHAQVESVQRMVGGGRRGPLR